MKMNIDRDVLKSALDSLRRLVPTVLSTKLLITAEADRIILSVTDMYVGGTVYCEADVEEGGTCLLSFTPFFTYVSNLGRSKAVLWTDEEGTFCWIRTDTSKGKMVCHDQETYTPSLNIEEDGLVEAFHLNGLDFQSTIDDVSFAAIGERGKGTSIEQREYFTCVLVKPLGEDSFDVVASDGFRMAHRTVKHDHAPLQEQMLIPATALRAFASVVSADDEVVYCYVSANRNVAIMSNGHIDFFTRTLEGVYPLFNNTYPLHYPLRVVIDTEALIAAVRLTTVYDGQKVYMDIGSGVLIVRSVKTAEGDTASELRCAVEGEGATISLPLDYLLGVLVQLKTKTCTISCDPTGPRKTVVFAPDTSRVRYSVMPLGK